MIRWESGMEGGGRRRRFEGLEAQAKELEQQMRGRHGVGQDMRPNKPLDAGGRVADQVQIYLRGEGSTSVGAGTGLQGAGQAVVMAELHTLRHMLSEASAVMNESAQRSDRLEDELGKCYEDLRVSRQSEEASEIALKVQTEMVEKSNAQIKQLTEELRQVRESQNEWRSKCEEYRLKLEQLSGSGDIESMREQLMQLKAQNNEYNRLRLLDAEKIATQQAAIERLDELEDKLNGKERSLRESKQEADNWRAKAEAFSAGM